MFEKSEKQLTREDILEFEKIQETTLPESLRKLLLKHNGGVLKGETIDDKFVYINGEKATYSFSSLFSIKYGENTIEFSIDALQVTEQHIPTDYIPFGDDMGGNIYTISTRKEEEGEIFYWELDVGEPRKNLVANSLEEFFEGNTAPPLELS